MELHINDADARTNAGVWLQRHLDGFLECLVAQGYALATITVYGRLVRAQCSELIARGLEVASLEADAAATLGDLAPEGSAAKTRELWKAAARRFVRYLCELGVLDPFAPEDARESDDLRPLRAAYEGWLRHQRGLSDQTVKNNLQVFTYLNQAEMAALVAAPDSSTWFGRRDKTLLIVALQTGLRVSELINLSRGDIVLGTGAHVRCMGKGRKERATPLRKDSVDALRSWLAELPGKDGDPLFISIRGGRLSRDAVERIVQKYAALATEVCPSLKDKRVTPHVLRHAAAMTLLQSGVDCAVIALWLGHESIETTQIYLHADLQLKEKAMDQTKPVGVPAGRYQPPDELMTFLEAL